MKSESGNKYPKFVPRGFYGLPIHDPAGNHTAEQGSHKTGEQVEEDFSEGHTILLIFGVFGALVVLILLLFWGAILLIAWFSVRDMVKFLKDARRE